MLRLTVHHPAHAFPPSLKCLLMTRALSLMRVVGTASLWSLSITPSTPCPPSRPNPPKPPLLMSKEMRVSPTSTLTKQWLLQFTISPGRSSVTFSRVLTSDPSHVIPLLLLFVDLFLDCCEYSTRPPLCPFATLSACCELIGSSHSSFHAPCRRPRTRGGGYLHRSHSSSSLSWSCFSSLCEGRGSRRVG
jgi:hypothetical protein